MKDDHQDKSQNDSLETDILEGDARYWVLGHISQSAIVAETGSANVEKY